MKILKKGVLPPDPDKKKYTVTCRCCLTKFQFKRSEANFEPSRDAFSEDTMDIECPLCKKKVYVKP